MPLVPMIVGRYAPEIGSSLIALSNPAGRRPAAATAWRTLLSGQVRWRLSLEHGAQFLGKEPQAALGHLVGRPSETEGDVELEIAQQRATRFQPPENPVGCAPARGLHEAGEGALEARLPGDLHLLLVGVVALDGLEVIAQ